MEECSVEDAKTMNRNKKESLDVAVLREKIRLKKIDRKVYVDEMENLLSGNREKRNALRIGNDCLRFMTRRQNNVSTLKNDGKLFRYGKRLMKEDFRKLCFERKKQFYKEELHRAALEASHRSEDFEKACESFLSQQVKVEDKRSREVSAKLVHQNLQKILNEVEKNLKEYPFRIKEIEAKIQERKREVNDFLELKAGAQRFLDIEESQLVPLNDELKIVNAHFEKIIAVKKQEMDDRRKSNSLARFLSERESHGFSFTGSSNIAEMKIAARNTALVNAQDLMVKLMDAMIVSDIRFVVDCILDQVDVTKLLKQEKEMQLEENAILTADLARLMRNNDVLKYNDVKQAGIRAVKLEALRIEQQEKRRFEALDDCLRKQDRLMSAISVSLHAMFERLRPIKMEDSENLYCGSLLTDAENFIAKLNKMRNLVEKRTVPVGRVKPLMLTLFKEKRIPADSIRVETEKGGLAGQMQSFEAYESDQPGYTTREMLKARAEEIQAKNKKIKAP